MTRIYCAAWLSLATACGHTAAPHRAAPAVIARCESPGAPPSTWPRVSVGSHPFISLLLPPGFESNSGGFTRRVPLAKSLLFSVLDFRVSSSFPPDTFGEPTMIDGVPATPGGRGDHGREETGRCLMPIAHSDVLLSVGREAGMGYWGYYLATDLPLSDSTALTVHALVPDSMALDEVRQAVQSLEIH